MKPTKFNPIWKSDPLFKACLQGDPSCIRNFYCSFCKTTLDLGNMGKGAVRKHLLSKIHVENSRRKSSSSAAMLDAWSSSASQSTPNNAENNVNEATDGSAAQQNQSPTSLPEANQIANSSIATR